MRERHVSKQGSGGARARKSPSTQAGDFVREEFHHIREGKHGARSPQQAIAIGLSKARRAGVRLPPPSSRRTSSKVRRQAQRDYQRGHEAQKGSVSPKRSRATLGALKRESKQAAAPRAISQQARRAARRRSPAERSDAARKAARTKGPARLAAAGRKAGRTRKSL